MMAEEAISFRTNFGRIVSRSRRGFINVDRLGPLVRLLPRGFPAPRNGTGFKRNWLGGKAGGSGVSLPTMNPHL